MKNSIPLICLLIMMGVSKAQNRKIIDTIYANEQKTVSMFFPNPIRQGITGSSNYAFSYNRDKEQYFGLLQATPGEESNLLVVTRDGEVYSYLLRYSQKLEKLNYFIEAAESIGNERTGSAILPEVEIKSPSNEIALDNAKIKEYSKLCSQFLRNPHPFDQIKFKDGVSIRMTKSIYYMNNVYILFEISNDSQIDFEINGLSLYKVNGNNKRKASYQELLISPNYVYNRPSVVHKDRTVQFVSVFPKFTLGPRARLMVKLDELNGNRDVIVKWK
ncbi:DUF4138 domain-containing protein [Arenibacter sp. S6351L]|uniref:DUF4138 domain-containing protein n=1 Tax=Arenibacter sp. S6351L TaxID=2926407 RepID=UPI001FF5B6D6|nr:DUF4138 domain-containing protein [Arenibacter sp. S6351L]MCK0135326.1 conjugative transposon protein TraN [Arenibacter sp. S6351L]